jgi:hypothetical protein
MLFVFVFLLENNNVNELFVLFLDKIGPGSSLSLVISDPQADAHFHSYVVFHQQISITSVFDRQQSSPTIPS